MTHLWSQQSELILLNRNATEPIAEGVFYATVDRPAVELARE